MALRQAARLDVRRNVDLSVEGIEFLPPEGAVILAARHYHHLHDGAAVVATVPRPVHILVGLDWIEHPAGKWVMDRACAAAGWPVVLRRRPDDDTHDAGARRALVAALNHSRTLLQQGRVLLVFPEGYPTIDPGYTPKTGDDELLPFQPGVVRLAETASRQGVAVPIVPVGLEYQRGSRWHLTMRFGPPVMVTSRTEEPAALARLEEAVRTLSGLKGAGERLL